NAIVDIQACGNHQPRNFGADGQDDLARQASAVLQAAAVTPGPGFGSQQLVEEITVALLDVDKLKAAALSQPGSRYVILDQALQVIIAQQRIIGRDRLTRSFVRNS